MRKKIQLFLPTLLVVLLAVVVSAILDYRNSYAILHEALADKQLHIANDLANSVTEAIGVAERTAATLASLPVVLDTLQNYGNPNFARDARLREVLAQVSDNSFALSRAALFDRDGEAIFYYNPKSPPHLAQSDYFIRAQEGKVFTTHSFSQSTGKPAIYHVRPIMDEGKFIGVVRITLDLKGITQKWLAALPEDRGYRFRIVDEHGDIIYSTVEQENNELKNIRSLPIGKILEHAPQTLLEIEDHYHDNLRRLALMVQVPTKELTLYVLAGINQAAVFSRVSELTISAMLVNTAIAVFVILVIIYTLNKLFATIKNLENANRQALIVANAELEKAVAARTAESTQERLMLRTAIDAIPDLIFYKSLHNVYLACNTAFAQFFGKTVEEFIGRTDTEIFGLSANDAEKFIAADRRVMQTKQLFRFEEDLVDTQGQVICFETIKSPCMDKQGNVFGVLGVCRDMSARKAMEQELIATRELALAASSAKSDFLANMSHEIRTPMNGIIGLSHLALQNENTPPPVRNYLHKIDTSAKLLLRIINDILDFSKIEAGKLEMEYIPFNLEAVLEDVIQPLLPTITDKGLELVYDLAADAPQALVGDPTRLGQVILNLVSNAVKFTPTGSIIIRIKALEQTANDATLQIAIIDTGIGITAEKTAQLFHAFTQVDSSITRRYGGTGLGLSICKSLVKMMGGEIGVTSEIGNGTTFFFTAKFGRHKETQRKFNTEKIKDWHVLVIDDNDISRKIIEHHLSGFGAKISLVESGEKGLGFFEKAIADGNPFDIVIVDWKMPGIDGIETARQLRIKNTGAKIPTIIMVTAHERELIINEAKSAGISSVLTKPVTPSALCETILTVYVQNNHDAGEATAAQSAHKIVTLLAPAKTPLPLRNKRILLTEDNEINQLVAREILESYGCAVTIAENGLEAVKKVFTQTFDAVLMDIQMPEMDGFTATRRIRENPDFVDLPIIAMTAHAMSGDEEKSLHAGMQAHVTKPINPNTLFITLVQWLKKH